MRLREGYLVLHLVLMDDLYNLDTIEACLRQPHVGIHSH